MTIAWPMGQRQPEEGKVYRVQRSSEEIAEVQRIELRARQERPETHREVLAEMYRRHHGEYPEGYEPPKPEKSNGQTELQIKVLEVEILPKGWAAKVMQWEEPDPVHGAGVKARHYHPDGPTTLQTYGQAVTEGEPERLAREIEDELTRETRQQERAPVEAAIAEIEEQLDVIDADPAGRRVGGELTFLRGRLERLKRKAGRLTEAQ
ncbi:MAG TPA: hypothetical protein VF009_07020 [Solirubrobacterales bacterium]